MSNEYSYSLIKAELTKNQRITTTGSSLFLPQYLSILRLLNRKNMSKHGDSNIPYILRFFNFFSFFHRHFRWFLINYPNRVVSHRRRPYLKTNCWWSMYSAIGSFYQRWACLSGDGGVVQKGNGKVVTIFSRSRGVATNSMFPPQSHHFRKRISPLLNEDWKKLR